MLTVTKTVKFDAAHVLTNHKGLCKNLHGHTYRVDLSVSDELRVTSDEWRNHPSLNTQHSTLNTSDADMVIDFKDLKRIAAETICDVFDHAFIYNTESEGEREIAAVVEKHGMRTVALPFRSTAENLARHFHALLQPKIPGLCAVKVWETADSSAEYRAS